MGGGGGRSAVQITPGFDVATAAAGSQSGFIVVVVAFNSRPRASTVDVADAVVAVEDV